MLVQEIDDLVEEWQPEPLVAPQTAFEEAEMEKLPIIVGYVHPALSAYISSDNEIVLLVRESSFPMAAMSSTSHRTISITSSVMSR